MMHSKTPPKVLSQVKRRLCLVWTKETEDSIWLLRSKTSRLSDSVTANLVKMEISTHTLRNGRKELLSDHPFAKDRIHREGGRCHAVLPRHPEWVQAVVQIIEPHTAGLPQDENVVWVSPLLFKVQPYRTSAVLSDNPKLEWHSADVSWRCCRESRHDNHQNRTESICRHKQQNLWYQETGWWIVWEKTRMAGRFLADTSKVELSHQTYQLRQLIF